MTEDCHKAQQQQQKRHQSFVLFLVLLFFKAANSFHSEFFCFFFSEVFGLRQAHFTLQPGITTAIKKGITTTTIN